MGNILIGLTELAGILLLLALGYFILRIILAYTEGRRKAREPAP